MVFKVAKLLAFDNVDVQVAGAQSHASNPANHFNGGVKLLIDTSVVVAYFCRESAILGNATLIRSGMLGYPKCIKFVTDAIRVKPSEVKALKPLEWIEVKRRTWEKRTGLISFDEPSAMRR